MNMMDLVVNYKHSHLLLIFKKHYIIPSRTFFYLRKHPELYDLLFYKHKVFLSFLSQFAMKDANR